MNKKSQHMKDNSLFPSSYVKYSVVYTNCNLICKQPTMKFQKMLFLFM